MAYFDDIQFPPFPYGWDLPALYTSELSYQQLLYAVWRGVTDAITAGKDL